MKGNPIGTVGTGEKFLGGYVMGGFGSGSTVYSSIVKFIFRLETVANISSTIPRATYGNDDTGFSNNNVAGYSPQGIQAESLRAEVYKLLYSGETTSTLSATLSAGYYYALGFTYGNTAGYVAGGFFTSDRSRNLDKIMYSNDSKSQVSSTFFAERRSEGSSGYSSANGYCLGGQVSYFNDVDKVVFSNETTSVISNVLTTDYYESSAATRLDTCVYVWTNYFGMSSPTTINKFNVSNDTSSALSATVSNARITVQSVWSRTAAYSLGGYSYSNNSPIDLIQKLSFSNESVSTLSATLPTIRGGGCGVSNN